MASTFFSFCKTRRLFSRIKEEIFDPELETVLHPTQSRFKWLGIFTLFGHPFFWYVWTVVCPQPYESLGARIFLALSGAGFFYAQSSLHRENVLSSHYFSLVFWVQMPLFFTWMYWQNGGNSVWLATLTTVILLYFHLTDWRLATVGLLSGMLVATGISYWQLSRLPALPLENVMVIAFSFFVSIALAASSANVRRERLRHSLVVIGIMAHELRTPLATASLIGQAMLVEAKNVDEKSRNRAIDKLAKKLELLTRTINYHIDAQMMNARLMQLPKTKQLISATGLVNKAVTQYPFSSKKEEDCVELVIHEDFLFYGSERQFIQVLNNLLKNALHSLKAAQSRFEPGDLHIELGSRTGVGRIVITDKGMGIKAENVARIFEPFFSTNNDTGHGLGLAYCKQVVQNASGNLYVKSQPVVGATFTIELPIQTIAVGDPSHHALSSLSSS
jgi:two-component system, CAI-1 autoinducer sensor kinase/phosphatase CqsS